MADYTEADDVQCEHVDPNLTSFENEYGDVEVNLQFPEFVHMCPITGRPDQGVLEVTYIPKDAILEEKSFRDYLYEYQNKGIWHEAVVADIKDHIVDAIDPVYLEVVIEFKARGGIYTTVRSEYDNRDSTTG